MNIYYITVKFYGTIVDNTPVVNTTVPDNTTEIPVDTYVPTSIYFNLTAIDSKSNG